ncbi:hypothetical protein, conserved (fragment), partial [Trypanosoma vivax Y486]
MLVTSVAQECVDVGRATLLLRASITLLNLFFTCCVPGAAQCCVLVRRRPASEVLVSRASRRDMLRCMYVQVVSVTVGVSVLRRRQRCEQPAKRLRECAAVRTACCVTVCLCVLVSRCVCVLWVRAFSVLAVFCAPMSCVVAALCGLSGWSSASYLRAYFCLSCSSASAVCLPHGACVPVHFFRRACKSFTVCVVSSTILFKMSSAFADHSNAVCCVLSPLTWFVLSPAGVMRMSPANKGFHAQPPAPFVPLLIPCSVFVSCASSVRTPGPFAVCQLRNCVSGHALKALLVETSICVLLCELAVNLCGCFTCSFSVPLATRTSLATSYSLSVCSASILVAISDIFAASTAHPSAVTTAATLA